MGVLKKRPRKNEEPKLRILDEDDDGVVRLDEKEKQGKKERGLTEEEVFSDLDDEGEDEGWIKAEYEDDKEEEERGEVDESDTEEWSEDDLFSDLDDELEEADVNEEDQGSQSEGDEEVERIEELFMKKGEGRVRPDREALDKMLGTREVDVSNEGEESLELTDPEGDWRDEAGTIPMGWFALLLVVLLGVVGWMFFRTNEEKVNVEAVVEEVVFHREKEEGIRDDAQEYYAEIEGVIRGYLLAKSVSEKAKYVRHPDRVAPLMTKYYEEHELRAVEFDRIENFISLVIENYPFVAVSSKIKNGDDVVLLLDTRGDRVKVDWESNVVYQEVAFEDFVKSRTTKPKDFRVFARMDNHYAGGYSEGEYVCYLLDIGNTDDYIFGYAKRGSKEHQEIHRTLAPGLKSGQGRQPMILSLRHLPSKTGRGAVLIDSFKAPRWAYYKDPDGE